VKYTGIITPTKDLVNKHLGMMRIDLNKFFTIMKASLSIRKKIMTEQSNNGNANRPANNNNQNPNGPSNGPRRNNRRRHHNRPRGEGAPQGGNNPQQANGQPRPQHNQNNNPNQQKRRPQHQNQNQNRPRPQQPNQQGGGFNIERIYEKYLNLMDQHIIARRKYHDLFYRADPAQKNKLERNFYNTLNEVREFENKLAPDVKVLFEKRNNGYHPDRIYTTNHELPIEGDAVPADLPPAEPHLLQSQIAADYSGDTEESVGTAEDYLKYKNF
jgi:DNA mismatch repair ATPase MutL